MPLPKSQLLILSNLQHSREPIIEGSQYHKFDSDMKTMAISAVSSLETTLKTQISSSSSLSLENENNSSNSNETSPWGPMFKDYQDFIDAHAF